MPDLVSKLREVIAKVKPLMEKATPMPWSTNSQFIPQASAKILIGSDRRSIAYVGMNPQSKEWETHAQDITNTLLIIAAVNAMDELESLIGREGQAARTFDEWWLSEGINHMPRGDQPPEHAAIAKLAWDAAQSCGPIPPEKVEVCGVCGDFLAGDYCATCDAHVEEDARDRAPAPCGPSQPETEGGIGRHPSAEEPPSVQATHPTRASAAGETAFLEDVLSHLNEEHGAPAGEELWAAKELIRMRLGTLSPSTPIVPGTAGLSAFADEIKLLLKMAEDCDARGEVQSPQKEWTFYQGKIVAYKHILSLLGAAKPVGISIDALEDLMQQFKQREARIRKDVLEEAAQHVPKLVCSDGPISQNAGGSYTIATVGCSCGWNGNPAGGWSAHILVAERPAPAGEVKLRWQCPHCAHVNSMTSANCENCKIPLVNTAGEVKGEK